MRKPSTFATGERVCLPRRKGAFPDQAFASGSAVGIPFHPEITYAQMTAGPATIAPA